MSHKSNFILASGVRTASGTQEFKMEGANASAYLDVTAISAGTSLNVVLQAEDPASLKWFNVGASFTQVTVTPGNERITISNLPDLNLRWSWTIVGTSYTFSIGMAMHEEG